jgi:hypothetical protein
MMKKAWKFCFSAVLAAVCAGYGAPDARAANVNVREGKWESTMEMKMEGMSFPIPPVKTTQCITKDDLIPKGKDQNKCKVKNQKITGNTVTWSMECEDRGTKTESQGEITYTGEGYHGTMRMKSVDKSGQTMVATGKMSGRRIGACTGKDDKTVSVGGKEMKVDPAMMEQAKQAQAEGEKRQAEGKARSAEFAKLAVPVEDSGACTLAGEGFRDSADCERKVGKLRLNPGQWEITTEQATKLEKDYYPGQPETTTTCLTSESIVPHISGMDASKAQNKKRSAGKITWKSRQDVYGMIVDEQGGINYKGDTLEGVVVRKQTDKSGTATEMKTRIAGRRIGDGNCLAQKRDYTSQKRDYTSQKRKAPASKQEPGVGDAVNKLKGLFGR